MYLPLLYCIKAVVCRLYEMLYPCICNVLISCWKSGAYDFVICRGGTDMCFVPGSGWKHLDQEQYRISGLTVISSFYSFVLTRWLTWPVVFATRATSRTHLLAIMLPKINTILDLLVTDCPNCKCSVQQTLKVVVLCK